MGEVEKKTKLTIGLSKIDPLLKDVTFDQVEFENEKIMLALGWKKIDKVHEEFTEYFPISRILSQVLEDFLSSNQYSIRIRKKD